MKLVVDSREAWVYTGGRPFDATRPCVLMLHGALNDHSVWALQSRALAHAGFGVLAVDLPGHGRSPGPALPGIEALADWAVALLDAAGVRRAALVGHSMGSLIALEAAARLGERATHLALVATAMPMKVSPALLEAAREEPLRAIDLVTSLSIAGLASKPSAPAPGFWLHGGLRALMRRMQAGHSHAGHGNLFHHDFSICDRYAGGPAACARARCPVLLILGRRDQMTPPRAAAPLSAALPGASVVELEAGHASMSEQPGEVLAALRTFLGG